MSAVTADNIIREDFKLGLVIHGRVIAEQKRLALHAAIGLLRKLTHNDLALINARGFIIDDMLEQLAALAMRHSMINNKRRVCMLLALEQAHTTQANLGIFASAAHKELTTQHITRIDISE